MGNNLVRICKDCGTVYGASKKRCETCGTRLSEPMENEKAIGMSDDILEENEKKTELIKQARSKVRDGSSYEEEITTQIPVDRIRITAGIIQIIACVGAILHWIWFAVNKPESDISSLPIYLFFYLYIALVIFPLGPLTILDCFAPNFTWALKHFGVRYQYRSIEPSDEYIIITRAVNLVFAIISLAVVIIAALVIIF